MDNLSAHIFYEENTSANVLTRMRRSGHLRTTCMKGGTALNLGQGFASPLSASSFFSFSFFLIKAFYSYIN